MIQEDRMSRPLRSLYKQVKILIMIMLMANIALSPVHAKTTIMPTKPKSNTLSIHNYPFSAKEAVVVETNRWKPYECMWIANKSDVNLSDLQIVFPYAELFNAVCHVIVGVSDSHYSFIHVTPLTSFFRKETGELEKIIANLKTVTGKHEKWSFKVYYFADNGREAKFRKVIAKVLRNSPTTFTELTPSGYSGGDINLVFSEDRFSYSVQDYRKSITKSASAKGSFNSIPIEAIE
jgi:hypothetical protein